MADRSAVFTDRDGTLIEDTGFVGHRSQVQLLPGAGEGLGRLNRAGILAVLVTNQSGIARGLFSREDFDATQQELAGLLGANGAHLDGVYMCPHHPDFDGPCECRKPGLALYQQAARDLSIDLARSFYVGDRWRDVAMTEKLGGKPILVSTGAGGSDAPTEITRVSDFAGAVDLILDLMNSHD